jgi:lysylphosphatidylglycerol synthetase-like protein (DUF2156 family)
MTKPYLKGGQGDRHTSQTQAQHPLERRQLTQPLGLVCPIHPLWVVPKRATTMAATIAIRLHTPKATISHRLAYFAPALKSLPLAIATFLGTSFCFALDIWQLQDDNRHGKLLSDGGWRTTILLELALFVKTHHLCYRHKY